MPILTTDDIAATFYINDKTQCYVQIGGPFVVDANDFIEWHTSQIGWPPSLAPIFMPNPLYVILDDDQYVLFKLRFA